MLDPSSREDEWWPIDRDDHPCLHCDASNSPGISLSHPRTGLSEKCKEKLTHLERVTTCKTELPSDMASLQSAVLNLDGIPHSWVVHMMFQTFGVNVRTKFTDAKMQLLFDFNSLERTMRWNNVAHMDLVQDIRDVAEVMLKNCLVPLAVLMKNSYVFQNKPIFLWSEKYLRRCFDVTEIYWISCEDVFTRAREIICGVPDTIHASKVCSPRLQPNATKLPGFQIFFSSQKSNSPSTPIKTMNTTTDDSLSSSGWSTDDEYSTTDFRATMK